MPKAATTTEKTPKRPRKAAAKQSRITPDHVREHAYYIHLAEGGDPLANWVRAERELLAPA